MTSKLTQEQKQKLANHKFDTSDYVVMDTKSSKRNKYNAKKVEAFGMTFDSIGEYERYIFLKSQETQGEIQNLQCQVKYGIRINGYHIRYYIADFVYTRNGKEVVEDFKGMATEVFKIKKLLMKAVNDIDVNVVKIPTEW